MSRSLNVSTHDSVTTVPIHHCADSLAGWPHVVSPFSGVYLDFLPRGGSPYSQGRGLVSEVGGVLNTSVMITDQCTNYKQQEAYRPTKHSPRQ